MLFLFTSVIEALSSVPQTLGDVSSSCISQIIFLFCLGQILMISIRVAAQMLLVLSTAASCPPRMQLGATDYTSGLVHT